MRGFASLPPREIPLDGLEETLPFSFGRPAEALAESIAAFGLLRPLWVWSEGPRRRLLAGNLRLRALKILGRASAPALFAPRDVAWPQALALALADNQGRPANPAETALVWRFLTDDLGAAAADELGGLLGLERGSKYRALHLAAAALPPRGLAALAEGRLDTAAAARLAPWPAADTEAVLALFDHLRPTLSARRAWLDDLEDLSHNLSPALLLADPGLKTLMEELEPRGRPAVEAAARAWLAARRRPRLTALRARRAAQIKALNLPPALRLAADPDFEDLEFSLTLTFSDLKNFKALADFLAGLKNAPTFRDLLTDGPPDA